ncbi:histidinol-phosphatase [Natronospira proteinivora]|uniref:Histidinol-phosphatase n=1 Tax=Natronospira proteinivora TaxID=1807133 RepID=A0ABT1GC16_9GAMM|nr:inositol monophosphatase family protein [Natronospira proteinivora]MCP1728470.1 histidinol-phosphatase [Natronospira proteinivora]
MNQRSGRHRDQDYSAYLATARRAVAAAARVMADAVQGPRDVRIKADQTPVTEVDLAAERAIVKVIAEDWPAHAIWSEEQGAGDLAAEWLWLIDPLDGTRSFIRGTPFFSTQVALMHRGRLVLGVSHAPGFSETAWAMQGGGAFLNDEPISVSETGGLRDATLSTGNLASLAARPRAWADFGRLVSQVERIRGYGDFCHYHLLARGALDAVLESDVNILDVAALAVIVEEAGGRMTQLDGQPLGLGSRDVLASNRRLHDTLRRRLPWDGKDQ